MKALILAGGKGTRLRPLTVYTPKPIVSVLNRPFLIYQIEILRRAGIEDIILSLNYQPDKIKVMLGDGSEYGVNITYVTEPSPMGTAGAVGYAVSNESDVVVLNGDIFTDLVVKDLLEQHSASKADATLCLTPVDDPSAYGMVKTDDEDNILDFLEKPSLDSITPGTRSFVNAGIYVLSPSVLELIKKGENSSFEYDVFPAAIEKNLKLSAFKMENDYWCDIGTPQKYLRAHHDFLMGTVKRFNVEWRSENAEIAPEAQVDKRSMIAENCVIKPNAVIRNSVIGEGVHVEEHALIEDSVIWSHSRVSDYSKVQSAILGKGCYVGKHTVVSAGTVLGDKASLTDYSIT